jgi:type II secretory pathway component GspD/PulD (secretin)
MRAITYVSLALWALSAQGQGGLEVIELQHRTAEQVLPDLRPLVEPGGVLTGQRNQLIVRTSPQNLVEIRRALDALDRPARRLVISVRFDDAATDERSAFAAGGAVSTQGARASLQAADTRSAANERVDQRVQVLEGGRARLATGQSRPVRQSQILGNPGTPVQRQSVVIQEITSGFEVVPRLSGSTVFLEIAQQREQPGAIPGSVQGQGATTTVSARLGEWVELGGISGAQSRDERGILSAARERSADSRRIWVRVDEVRP